MEKTIEQLKKESEEKAIKVKILIYNNVTGEYDILKNEGKKKSAYTSRVEEILRGSGVPNYSKKFWDEMRKEYKNNDPMENFRQRFYGKPFNNPSNKGFYY